MCPALPASSVGRAAVVAEARKWIGTPFAHIGRNEHAVDCAGLVIKVAHALGLSSFDFTCYAKRPDGETLQRLCDEHMRRKGLMEPGDVALIRFLKHPQHLGIIGDYPVVGHVSIIHAVRHGVVEHIVDDAWRHRIVQVYALPGVCS